MSDISNPVFDLEVKACAEALQSAQRRTRTAFFLSISAACIVGIMIFNLWQSRQLRNDPKVQAASRQSEDIREYNKHVEDSSFYQLPALGIQISCDDVGILGPLALLVFSVYCVISFRSCRGHADCSRRFESCPLIMTLLKTEMLPALFTPFLFLPSLACIFVIVYGASAHFGTLPAGDPLAPIFSAIGNIAKWLDGIGWALSVLVFACNVRACWFMWARSVKSQAPSRTFQSHDKVRAATAA